MKKVLVTGGYSLIGQAVVEKFLENNYFVYATSREKREEKRDNVKNITLDLEDKNLDIKEALKEIDELDVLVNNAGIFTEGKTEELSLELFNKVYDVNIKGLFLVTQYAIPLLKKTNGSIVNLSSLNAVLPGFGHTAHYDASKGFVKTYTKALAKETGLRVNAVAPGLVETERLKGLPIETDHIAHCVKKALVTSKEVAEAIYFLSIATGIYGETILVDNGYTLN